ncbi:MAG: hypothetical protein ACJ74G_06475 [Blastocatellia bacterium]
MDQRTFYIVVTVATAVITLSFLIQMAMMIGIARAVKRLTGVAEAIQKKVEPLIAKTEPIIAKVEPLVDQVQGTISNVRVAVDRITVQAQETFDKVTVETRAIAAAVSTSSREIAGLAQRQAEQVSSTVEMATMTLQRQIVEIDGLLTRTQDRIEDTTTEVQTGVLQPMRELSALLVGLRRTIEMLFGRGRKSIDQAYQDEEMFIG